MQHMNPHHLNRILDKFNIASHERTVSPVYGSRGGSFIWRIDTDCAETYAIKQLSPEIDLTNPAMLARYERSEIIASLFSEQGIPAVVALGEPNYRLTIIKNTGYLLYPWIEGYTLKRNEISASHALKMAEITARMHGINLDIPEMETIRFDMHDNNTILQAIEKALAHGHLFAKSLEAMQKIILDLNQNYQSALPLLREHAVITHGDLDQLNVIWNNKEAPCLIDWESARKMNPVHELVRTAFRFSGGGTESFSLPLFTEILHIYRQAGGFLDKDHVKAAIHALYGSTINWMLYNIRLACHGVSERSREACNEMDGILETITRSQTEMPQMLAVKPD